MTEFTSGLARIRSSSDDQRSTVHSLYRSSSGQGRKLASIKESFQSSEDAPRFGFLDEDQSRSPKFLAWIFAYPSSPDMRILSRSKIEQDRTWSRSSSGRESGVRKKRGRKVQNAVARARARALFCPEHETKESENTSREAGE